MPSLPFKKLPLKHFPQFIDQDNAENRYWQKFKLLPSITHVAPISYIEFCPVNGFDYAVTDSTRIHIYDGKTNLVKKTLSRFDDVVYSGSFRHDGKLMVAGGEKPVVKVMDLASRTILRQFSGHTAAVRCTKFSSNNIHILSGSDDKTIRLWDLPTQKPVSVIAAHNDYVKCASQALSSEHTWITGSYDHTVKLWDLRKCDGGKMSSHATMTMDHGHPIESCLVLPGGSVVISAGGNEVKVWDILSGGKLVYKFSSHQKTITNVTMDGTGSRLLTGSLDGHVKVYDMKTYEVTHGFKYNHGVLALGVSPNNSRIAVGTTNSALCVREKSLKTADVESQQASEEYIRGGTYKYFVRGKSSKPSQGDVVVQKRHNQRIAPYDKALRAFKYKDALDEALCTRSPVVVASMLEELRMRAGLKKSLAGRDEVTLEPLLSFLTKYITNPKYANLLIDLCDLVFDMYLPILGESDVIDNLFIQLQKKLHQEKQFHRKILGVVGVLDTIMAGQSAASI